MSSAQQKVQQHPAFQQAQAKAQYYIAQLDKEVCFACASGHICGAKLMSDVAARATYSSPSILSS
jgi:cytochrome c1